MISNHFPFVKVWFIIQLKQPFFKGTFRVPGVFWNFWGPTLIQLIVFSFLATSVVLVRTFDRTCRWMFPKLFGSIKQYTWAQENGWCIEGMNRFVTALEVHWESLFDWDATNPFVGGFFFFGILLLTPRRAWNPASKDLETTSKFVASQLSPFGDSGDLGKDDVKLKFFFFSYLSGNPCLDFRLEIRINWLFHLRPTYKWGILEV